MKDDSQNKDGKDVKSEIKNTETHDLPQEIIFEIIVPKENEMNKEKNDETGYYGGNEFMKMIADIICGRNRRKPEK